MAIFSQTTEYALRAVVWLASRYDEPQTTQQIAASTHVPPGYLSKVLQALGRADLVSSQRGLYGGFTLSRPPKEIRVLEVVNAVDPIERIKTCPLNIRSHGAQLCALHRRLDDAIAHVERAFAGSTLADLLADTSPSVPLCEAEVPNKRG